MTRIRKISLSLIVGGFILTLGIAYQFYYLEERTEYETAITEQFHRRYKRDPDPKKLRHLTTMALERYGLTAVYRNAEDYQRLLKDTS